MKASELILQLTEAELELLVASFGLGVDQNQARPMNNNLLLTASVLFVDGHQTPPKPLEAVTVTLSSEGNVVVHAADLVWRDYQHQGEMLGVVLYLNGVALDVGLIPDDPLPFMRDADVTIEWSSFGSLVLS